MKNPIIAQAAMDIEAARKIWLPWRILLPWGLFCLIVMLVCDHFGKLDISMPLLVSIGMFAFFIYLKWSLRREPLFWTTIAILASLHLALIWYIPWTPKWIPSLAIAGVASLDLCLMFWVLAAVEVLLGGGAEAEN
jgi:hypothetical protein